MEWNTLIKNYEGDPENHIAVVGMAGRFPEADTLEEFWKNLKEGRESITFFTQEELVKGNIEKRLIENPRYVGADAVIKDMDKFDAEFFGINPREAEILDPQHRLFLECAWELMEMAGYDSQSYDGKVSVFTSANLSSYLIRNIMANAEMRKTATSFHTLICNDKDFVGTRVSYKLGLTGGSLSVGTLCSSSSVAIHLACQNLLNWQCDMALAGAVSLQVSRNESFFYQEGGIGDPDGHCRAFDAKASGTVSGSGLGVVALKRLEDAVRDGDCIYGIIRATAMNNDGSHKISYTAPSVEGQTEVIANAIALADVNPETITYIEAHGTGTQLGDPIEIEALTKAFRLQTDKKQYCAVGSVKTNIGHLVNAGGVASLIKTLLALNNKQIPASLNYETPNQKINFKDSPFYVNNKLADWNTQGVPRRAGVSSFGIGGTNVHMIVEEAPVGEPSGPSREWHILPLSAKTSTALEKHTQNLYEYFGKEPDQSIADVSFTLQVGRRGFAHRRFVLCRNLAEAKEKLADKDSLASTSRFQETSDRPCVFILPGLVDDNIKAASELYQKEAIFKENLDYCADIVKEAFNVDILKYIKTGFDDKLSDKEAILNKALSFSIQYALMKLWNHWGVKPQAVFGCDAVGDCLAVHAAGIMELKDALILGVSGANTSLNAENLKKPSIRVLSPRTGEWLKNNEASDPAYWNRQSLKNWTGCLDAVFAEPAMVMLVLEMGGNVGEYAVSQKGKAEEQVVLSSLRKEEKSDPIGALLNTMGQVWLSGVKVDWNGFHSGEHRHRIALPTYPFERKSYWIYPEEVENASVGAEEDHKPSKITYHARPNLEVEYTAPRNDTEEKLCEIWQELLGIEKIGVFDDFFELGGHSLMVAQIASRAREVFKMDFPMRDIYEQPTVAFLAESIDNFRWAAEGEKSTESEGKREEGEL